MKISESGVAVYMVTAAKAEFKPRDSAVKLLAVVIHDAQANETLHCKTARLSKDGRLSIPGEYHLASPSGRHTRNGWVKQILKAG